MFIPAVGSPGPVEKHRKDRSMDEETRDATYESFREAAEEYGDERGDDLLTDSAAMAAAKKEAAIKDAVSHGDTVRESRKRQGFTLEELSEKTGIDTDVLEKLETGETFLPLGQLIRLSKALSLKMSDMISPGLESFTIVRADQRMA